MAAQTFLLSLFYKHFAIELFDRELDPNVVEVEISVPLA